MSYKINKYPDGTSYVSIPKEWEDTSREIIFKMNNYESVIHLAQLCDTLIHNRVKAHIILPCLLDSQADKRFNEFHSSGLLVLARFLEDYCDGYNISFGIFHPHNPEVTEALFTSVDIIDNSDFTDDVISRIVKGEKRDDWTLQHNLILMSSDAGGFKPLMKLCDKIKWRGETYSASKFRKYVDGESSLSQFVDRLDFGGKDILIVDDISVYGGTFKGLSKILKERNCGKLYLAVSHMTVQNLGKDPVTNYFDKVFTTNSKFDHYWEVIDEYGCKAQPKNLEVVKLF